LTLLTDHSLLNKPPSFFIVFVDTILILCLISPPRNRAFSRIVKEISLASMARSLEVNPNSPQRRSPGSPSDKENQGNSASASKRRNQSLAMSSSRSNTKRQRLRERASNVGSQSLPSRKHSNQFYDPDQDEKERRRIRKGLRDLTRDLNGNLA
jgi:hypothetical protein